MNIKGLRTNRLSELTVMEVEAILDDAIRIAYDEEINVLSTLAKRVGVPKKWFKDQVNKFENPIIRDKVGVVMTILESNLTEKALIKDVSQVIAKLSLETDFELGKNEEKERPKVRDINIVVMDTGVKLSHSEDEIQDTIDINYTINKTAINDAEKQDLEDDANG